MKKLGLIIVSCIFSLLSMHTLYAQEQDKLLQLLKQELAADMQELQKQENPPYHMNFRVMDDRTVNISSSFGATMMSVEQHSRSMVPQIRVGDTILDNFKYNAMGAPADQRGNVRVAYLGLDDEKGADATRQAIWAEVMKRYDFAVEAYQRAKTQSQVSVADEDKAPSFSAAPVEKYYEAPLPAEKLTVDQAAWEKRLNEVSAVFKAYPLLQSGDVSLTFRVLRNYFVNTEGTEVVQNRTYARIMISASMKAEDGMELPLNMSYFAYDPKDLPSNDRMIADA